jgi:hypothetical protein
VTDVLRILAKQNAVLRRRLDEVEARLAIDGG